MTWGKFCALSAVLLCSAAFANASGLTFTCDQTASGNPDNYAAGTCGYLNNTIAALYTSYFSNVNANIYIRQGTTGLGGSNTPKVFLSFNAYRSVLAGTTSSSAIDTGAVAALNSLDAAVYGSDNVVMSSALAAALGFTGLPGYTSLGGNCSLGTPNCYSGIITVTPPANLFSHNGQSLYYRQIGGSQTNAYDYYSVVEHETDEILGTVSCMNTQPTGGVLTDLCDFGVGAAAGTGTPGAIDLFRYNSPGSLAANNAYIGLGQAAAGAYFSWNGGLTNGANGAVFNTGANGDDYADFVSTSCSYVQDAEGCTGVILDVSTDGHAEFNMLDAIGYNSTPEPGTMVLFGAALAGFQPARRRLRV